MGCPLIGWVFILRWTQSRKCQAWSQASALSDARLCVQWKSTVIITTGDMNFFRLLSEWLGNNVTFLGEFGAWSQRGSFCFGLVCFYFFSCLLITSVWTLSKHLMAKERWTTTLMWSHESSSHIGITSPLPAGLLFTAGEIPVSWMPH